MIGQPRGAGGRESACLGGCEAARIEAVAVVQRRQRRKFGAIGDSAVHAQAVHPFGHAFRGVASTSAPCERRLDGEEA